MGARNVLPFSISLINSQLINSRYVRSIEPKHSSLYLFRLCRSVLGQGVSVGPQANLTKKA